MTSTALPRLLVRLQLPNLSSAAPLATRIRVLILPAARDLLARTAELPCTKRELLEVLRESRAAVFAFAFQTSRP